MVAPRWARSVPCCDARHLLLPPGNVAQAACWRRTSRAPDTLNAPMLDRTKFAAELRKLRTAPYTCVLESTPERKLLRFRESMVERLCADGGRMQEHPARRSSIRCTPSNADSDAAHVWTKALDRSGSVRARHRDGRLLRREATKSSFSFIDGYLADKLLIFVRIPADPLQ